MHKNQLTGWEKRVIPLKYLIEDSEFEDGEKKFPVIQTKTLFNTLIWVIIWKYMKSEK